MIKKLLSLITFFSLLESSILFAAPMPIVFPFLSIIPEKNTINVISARTVLLKYKVVNNLSYFVNDLKIDPTFNVATDLVGISYVNNTCGSRISQYGTCEFTLVLQGRNKTGSLTITPRLCIFTAGNCSVPQPENRLHVSVKVLRSLEIQADNPGVEVGKKLSLTAMAAYSDNTKAVVTKDVLWQSANPKVAKINAKTGVLTAIAPGNVTIVASSDNVTSNSVILTVLQPIAAPQQVLL